MPKAVKGDVKGVKKSARPKEIEVGSRVRVTTEYVVKRMLSVGHGDGPDGIVIVSVDDEHRDRVLNFRLGELELVE